MKRVYLSVSFPYPNETFEQRLLDVMRRAFDALSSGAGVTLSTSMRDVGFTLRRTNAELKRIKDEIYFLAQTHDVAVIIEIDANAPTD
jgi:hypothetical protein